MFVHTKLDKFVFWQITDICFLKKKKIIDIMYYLLWRSLSEIIFNTICERQTNTGLSVHNITILLSALFQQVSDT